MAIDSIPARLLSQAKASGDRPAYYTRVGGTWQPTTWSSYADEVRRACKALVALGFEPGHTTCILGFNRPEWVVFDVATMMAGGAPAGIYTTCSAAEVQYIIDHSEARIVVLEDAAQWHKVEAERERLPRLEHVVMMRGADAIDDPMVLTWEDFLACGDDVPDDTVEERLSGLQADAVATFIYTSGTTGPPKAVMLSHLNLAWTANMAVRLADATADDTSLSYLPLSHIAEQMFTIHVPITVGSSIYFAESIEAVPDNLREVQPSIIFGVPRIWEKMHAKVAPKLAEAEGIKRRLVDFALQVGRESSELRHTGQPRSLGHRIRHRLAHRLIFSKLHPLMGLSNARMCVTGAAPISKDVLEFFASLDITIHEVYGQSEDCGPTSFNVPGRTRLGTVGPVLPGTEVRFADDGEILVKGPHVFLGYYKDPAATAETLVDGWLHTGDLGALDDDGFLMITGRKKEIIITAGGKNIAPKNIEGALKDLPLVAQAVVIGDRRKFLSALVTLDPEAVAAFAADKGLPAEDLHAHPEVVAAIQEGIDAQVNPQFARVEYVRKFTVLPRDFSVEAGELTPTLKIKRNVVHEHFADEIEAMYQAPSGEVASA